MRRRSGLALAAIDLLGSLFLVALVQMAPPPKKMSSLATAGQYAIVLTWPASDTSDIDLYVRAPNGEIVYFNSKEAGGMHLESDDIPNASGYAKGQENFERVVIRTAQQGEYTVTVHVYRKDVKGVTPVWVVLWRLAGDDRILLRQRLGMGGWGNEQTAFRFTLKRDGSFGRHNRLPAQLVGR